MTTETQGIVWFAVLGVAGCAYGCSALVNRRTSGELRSVFFAAALLLSCWFAFGVSSGNGALLMVALGGSVFLILSLLILVTASLGRFSLAGVWLTCAIATIAGVITLSTASRAPYRKPPIALSTQQAVASWRGSLLFFDPESAKVLERLEVAARRAGFAHGTPLLDLTPFSPGIGYRLGSLPPTTIMLGFSAITAIWSLGQQDHATWCAAWILASARQDRSHIDPAQVTPTIGMHFPADYELIIVEPWDFGWSSPTLPNLQLWKPTLHLWKPSSAAVARCRT